MRQSSIWLWHERALNFLNPWFDKLFDNTPRTIPTIWYKTSYLTHFSLSVSFPFAVNSTLDSWARITSETYVVQLPFMYSLRVTQLALLLSFDAVKAAISPSGSLPCHKCNSWMIMSLSGFANITVSDTQGFKGAIYLLISLYQHLHCQINAKLRQERLIVRSGSWEMDSFFERFVYCGWNIFPKKSRKMWMLPKTPYSTKEKNTSGKTGTTQSTKEHFSIQKRFSMGSKPMMITLILWQRSECSMLFCKCVLYCFPVNAQFFFPDVQKEFRYQSSWWHTRHCFWTCMLWTCSIFAWSFGYLKTNMWFVSLVVPDMVIEVFCIQFLYWGRDVRAAGWGVRCADWIMN